MENKIYITEEGLFEIDFVNDTKKEVYVPRGTIGYVYKMYNPLIDKWYVGKKFIKCKRNGKEIESDWRKYYSSNQFIKEDIKQNGKENWIRFILCFCYSKLELSYNEMIHIIDNDWLDDDCLNSNIDGRYYKEKLNKSKKIRFLQ